MKRLIITIDGPSGAGKTTVSRILAGRLGYKYIDTGALYRGVALEAISAGLNPDDDTGLENVLSSLKMKFVYGEKGLRLISNDTDITDKIRTSEISMFASAASARPVVRNFFFELQRELGREKGVVFEGRDMGTVVFPDADVKFYLDASHKTRSLRRYQEFKSETSQTLQDVEKDIKRRDKNDSARDLAPLRPAKDAVIIDSTHLSAQDVVDRMMNVIGNKIIIVF
ncbi:MAG: (d)CMP kinase [Thermodesulfobacteriota bacterium]|nr:(d)CMP kinase [Thermodesulfobacteriota bacterium]